MEIKFAPFNKTENIDQQRALFIDCFPETNGEVIQAKEHYDWKFHSFPGNIKSWEYASYIADDMVGYYAAIPYHYKIAEKEVSVGMVCDVMTSSKYRGKGIFTKMGAYSTTELTAQVPFTMGYPIRKEVIPGHIKIGWKIPFSLPLYMKFIRMNALLKSKKIGILIPLANVIICLYNIIFKEKSIKSYSFTLSSNIQEIADYETFTNEWSNSVQNSLIKDLPFAIWRYGAPERSYKFLSIKDLNEKMVAFVSFRKILKEGVPSYGILDYMVLPGFENCHGIINNVLVKSAKNEKVEAIMTMMSKKSALKYKLHKNGYFKSPFLFQLIIKNLTKEFSDEELFNEDNWHLMWVDSDDL